MWVIKGKYKTTLLCPWIIYSIMWKIIVPYVGKILANLANGVQFAKIFHANSYKYSEDLPADSPKFSSPFASSVMIRQNFVPPKFSHVRYTFYFDLRWFHPLE